MHDVGRAAEKCLTAAAKYGEVIIITNSDDGWVDYSAETYVPNLLPVLPNYRIVSARTRYEQFDIHSRNQIRRSGQTIDTIG